MDIEVREYLSKCYEEAKSILRAHLDTMDKLAQHLIEKETITGKEFMRIYRDAEGIPEPTEEEKEKAKSRIWATRPESAAVGENVPVKDASSSKPTFEASVGGPAGTNNPGGIHYEDPAREFTTLFPHDTTGQETHANYGPQNQTPLSGQMPGQQGQYNGQSAQQQAQESGVVQQAGQAQTYGQPVQQPEANAQTYGQPVQQPEAGTHTSDQTGGDEPGRFSNATGLFDD